jgi:outer membrane lipoprotein-sorting protein
VSASTQRTPRARSVLCVLCLLCVLGSACGTPLIKLPSGPGAPATDIGEALTQATAACRGVRTLTAEVAASGKVSGQRFRARLSVGVAAPASARIEAVAPFGAPIFILAANDDDTTLLLPREDRVLEHGRSAAVLDAATGVPLSAADLRLMLAGCAAEPARPEGRALGADWRVIQENGNDALYLHRAAAAQPWQLVVAIRPPGRIEYRDHQNGLPRTIRLTSVAGARAASESFDLTLALSQVETNVTLGPDVFRVDVPRGAQPITLDELRHARPGVREN